jgi:hypothetical protein
LELGAGSLHFVQLRHSRTSDDLIVVVGVGFEEYNPNASIKPAKELATGDTIIDRCADC